MANQARNERQVMRQRGAGNRNVSNADFGLDFDAGSRQQRQLMRQRGAGNRQISNVDFGIAFATPTGFDRRRSRTRSKTPATAVQRHQSAQVTPAQYDFQPVLQTSNSAQSIRNRPSTGLEKADLAVERSERPQRKRRRLSQVSDMSEATSINLPLASIGNHDLDEDTGSMNEASGERIGDVQQHEDVPSSPLFFPDKPAGVTNEADKENEVISGNVVKAASKKRKRRSIGQQSLFKKKRNSGGSKQQIPTPPQTAEESGLSAPLSGGSQSHLPSRRWSLESTEPRLDSSSVRPKPSQQSVEKPVINSTLPRSRKKRKSIGQTRKNRRSSGMTVPTPSQLVNSIETSEEASLNERLGTSESGDRSLDVLENSNTEPRDRSLQLGKDTLRVFANPNRFRSEEAEPIHVQDNEDADDTYLPDEVSPEPTPARLLKHKQQQRKASHSHRSTGGPGQRSKGIRKQSSKSAISILTYRAVNTHTLPTITEVDEVDRDTNDPETDELALAAPSAITTRSTPNAVDVLAQTCHEMIENAISDLKNKPSEASGSRSELKKGITALESFQSHLSTILFTTSQSLDQRLNLEARLRKSRREKAELQARWLEIRRRRDQLDLRKDAIRREHWENEVLERKRVAASEAAFGLEIAVARQRENEAVEQGQGLEFMLRSLAGDVSNSSNDADGSILQALEGFNGNLERLVNVLG